MCEDKKYTFNVHEDKGVWRHHLDFVTGHLYLDEERFWSTFKMVETFVLHIFMCMKIYFVLYIIFLYVCLLSLLCKIC